MNKNIVLNCDNTRYNICIIDGKVFGFSVGGKMYICSSISENKYTCSLFVDLDKFVEDISKISTEEDLYNFYVKLEKIGE